jgi:hypothetical protein
MLETNNMSQLIDEFLIKKIQRVNSNRKNGNEVFSEYIDDISFE